MLFGKTKLSFREHDEQVISINKRNYVELIHLMSTLNPNLNRFLFFSKFTKEIKMVIIQLFLILYSLY